MHFYPTDISVVLILSTDVISWVLLLKCRTTNAWKDMSCVTWNYSDTPHNCSHGPGPLGSVLPNEFHFMKEQKHQSLAITFAVISHVPLLYISEDHTCQKTASQLVTMTPLVILFKTRHSKFYMFLYIWEPPTLRGPWYLIDSNHKGRKTILNFIILIMFASVRKKATNLIMCVVIWVCWLVGDCSDCI